MAHQELFLNKKLILIGLVLLSLTSCGNDILHESTLIRSSVLVQTKGGITFVNGNTFTGILVDLYPNQTDTFRVQTFFNGKEHGFWKEFYPTKQLKSVRYFENGKKEGDYISYWENGNQKFHFRFLHDEYEGESLEWNVEGILTKEMHYEKGYENGTQKLWYDDGRIKSNYVIKNGRRFGLLGTKNCTNVTDSLFTTL